MTDYNVDIDDQGRTVCDYYCTECEATRSHYINYERLMCKHCLKVTLINPKKETS